MSFGWGKMIFPRSIIDDFVRCRAHTSLADDFAAARFSLVVEKYIESLLLNLPTVRGRAESNDQMGETITDDFLMQDTETSESTLHIPADEVLKFMKKVR